jgi:hypothetical protein
LQLGLDIAGLAPVIGELADAVNALLSLFRGDYIGATFSSAAMLPVGGQAATAAKLGRQAAKGTTKIDDAAKAVEDFLGGQGKIIKNADGDTILMRGDKKIRFDIKDPHGDKPHFQLELQTPSGKWKDAGPDHRYYFKEDGK